MLPAAVACCTGAGSGTASKNSASLVPLNEDAVRGVVRTLEQGFKLKSMDTLQRCFAENFSVSVAAWPAAKRYVEPMLEKDLVKGVSFVALTDTSEGSCRLVRLKVEDPAGGEHETLAAVDETCKIVFVDYFDRLYGHSRYSASVRKASVPFELQDGQIVLAVRLNGSPAVLRFLFDTGADGMAIRSSLADSLGLRLSHRQEVSVVGGKMQVALSAGNTVHLTDSFSLKSQSIALFPTVKHGLDGIIGLNLAAESIVGVDFDKKLLTLSSFGARRAEAEGKAEANGVVVPVNNGYGAMTLSGILNIAGKEAVTGHFIFDTGATYHLIAFSRFVRKNRLLLTGFKPEEQASTVSMGRATPVFHGKAHRFELAPEVAFTDMPVTLQASSSTDSDLRTPDGSIGIKLIQNFNFTVDLLQKELTLYRRK